MFALKRVLSARYTSYKMETVNEAQLHKMFFNITNFTKFTINYFWDTNEISTTVRMIMGS